MDTKTLREWAAEYGTSYQTAVKRRAMAGVGRSIPPHTWLLTKREFEIVLKTPLPGCTRVM